MITVSRTKMKLRKIVIATIIAILLLLAFTIVLSMLWPSSWNPLLGSSLINMTTSLMGVMVGVIVAIFVVERYLESQRRQAQKKEEVIRYVRRRYYIGLMQGGLSVIVESVVHLSYYILYGSGKWRALMAFRDEQMQAAENIHDFTMAIMKEEVNLTKEKLAKFENGFEELPDSSIIFSPSDIKFIIDYVEMSVKRIRDYLFLFQPFVEEHFIFVRSVVDFVRSLDKTTSYNHFSLALVTKKGKSEQSIHLDNKGQHLFQSLGKEAVKVSTLILNEYLSGNKKES